MRIYCLLLALLQVLLILLLTNCHSDPSSTPEDTTSVQRVFYPVDKFLMGADLSYVNQILDHNGLYKDSNQVRNPYDIFKHHGANMVRLRLWHNPAWTKTVYGDDGTQLYNDLRDVAKAIAAAKARGIAVNLDFHFSDRWADPDSQEVPAAWHAVEDMDVMKDSIYNYTKNVLSTLQQQGLMPEMVQLGNEINCGMLHPYGDVCVNKWETLGGFINSALQAVREIDVLSGNHTDVVLHIADPQYTEWWFDNITTTAGVTDFDVIGLSFYPLWHTSSTVSIDNLGVKIASFRERYQKKVAIVETGYPWTTDRSHNYATIMGSQPALTNYPFTPQGQYDLMVRMTQEVITGGGIGIFYWEPAWIDSDIKDLFGSGTAYSNCTFFDFNGNVIKGIDFMTYPYKFQN